MAPMRSRRKAPRRSYKSKYVAKRVFESPELVAEIANWLVKDLASRSNDGLYQSHLAEPMWPYLKINEVWRTGVNRLSWKSPICFRLNEIFENVSLTRRQQYADHVQNALLVTVSDNKIRASDSALRGVNFPKLRRLSLHIAATNEHFSTIYDTFIDGIHIPCIQGESVTILSINNCCNRCQFGKSTFHRGKRYLYGLPDEWERLFKRISVTQSYEYMIAKLLI
jgi:hypothetical protein